MLLTWTLNEESQNTSHFHLKYFPVLFPNMLVVVNTTDTRYEAVGLIPQATYVFELLPIMEEDGASQSMSTEVVLHNPLCKLVNYFPTNNYVVIIIIILFIAPVENVSAVLNSESSVVVSWSMKYELPGWSSLYFFVYYSAYSPDGLHSINQQFEVSEMSTVIKMVHEADWQHQFQVSVVLAVGVEGLEIIESEKRGAILTVDLGMLLSVLK